MILYSTTAIIKGLLTCLKDSKVRRLALLPWLIGGFCYLASLIAAYFAHQPLLTLLVNPPTSWWSSIVYGAAWLLVSALLLVCTLIVSITFTLILAGPFHSAIAEYILSQNTDYSPPESSVKELAKETSRAIISETTKLVWLTPLLLILLVIGFIPLLTPIALLLGAWLLAFQFIDIPLDLLKFPTRKRIGFCLNHFICCIFFGASLSLLWAIPLLGVFLSPAAAVAATLLVAKIRSNEFV